jgi:hypothetical protein
LIDRDVYICITLMHNDVMNNTLSPPPSSVRVTVPVAPEVLEVFQRLAKAGSMSTGRAMGDWLGDTVEAAELMASTMERARAAPKLVTAELHAMALGMTDQTKELMDKFAKMGKKARSGVGGLPTRPTGPLVSLIPPSCNTGGKVPRENPKGPSSKKGKRA